MLVSDPEDCSNMDQSMEPIFKPLKWQLQDLLDTVETIIKPQIPVHLGSDIPESIHIFKSAIPPSKDSFDQLVNLCLTTPVEFNKFKVSTNSISCNFSFLSQDQNLQILTFKKIKSSDQDSLQKKLLSLKFQYDIPNTHLSFIIPASRYLFVWNASYNTFVGDLGCSYSKFLENFQPPATESETAPGTSGIERIIEDFQNLPPDSPSLSKSPPPFPNLVLGDTPSRPSHEASRTTLMHALAENRSKSRLATANIATLKGAVESVNVSFDSDFVISKLKSKTNWKNNELALLMLAISGIIQVKEPTGVETAPTDEIQEDNEHDEEQ